MTEDSTRFVAIATNGLKILIGGGAVVRPDVWNSRITRIDNSGANVPHYQRWLANPVFRAKNQSPTHR